MYEIGLLFYYQVLYFGDSLRSDVFPSKQYANWETVYILEEMDLETMTECEKNNDGEPQAKKQKILEVGTDNSYMNPSRGRCKQFIHESL